MQGFSYTGSMSSDAMQATIGALGAYLKAMREGQSLEPKDVLPQLSRRLGKTVDHSRLWRAENGKHNRWPEGDFLAALLDLIGGDLRDIRWIQEHPEITADEGRGLAEQRLRLFAEQSNTEERRAIADRLRRMAEDLEAGQ